MPYLIWILIHINDWNQQKAPQACFWTKQACGRYDEICEVKLTSSENYSD